VPGTGIHARPRSGGRHGSTALQQAERVDLGGGKPGSEAGTPAARAARVAHDIQTPVAIILGLCARLEAAGVDAGQAADIARIRAQAGAIGRSAGTLVQSPATQPQPTLVDAARLAREVSGDLAVLARDRGAQVIVVDAGAVALVRDDDAQLRPAITNLVANAIRQVGLGGLVRCSVRALSGSVTIEVADSGPGVPPAERDALLRPYAQGSGRRGTAGLGLSIVSDAAEALGGTLTVGQAREGGAAFTLSLPRARSAGTQRRRRS
jgi:signal transduction histidine kinase